MPEKEGCILRVRRVVGRCSDVGERKKRLRSKGGKTCGMESRRFRTERKWRNIRRPQRGFDQSYIHHELFPTGMWSRPRRGKASTAWGTTCATWSKPEIRARAHFSIARSPVLMGSLPHSTSLSLGLRPYPNSHTWTNHLRYSIQYWYTT